MTDAAPVAVNTPADTSNGDASNVESDIDYDNPTGEQVSEILKKAQSSNKDVHQYMQEEKAKQTKKPESRVNDVKTVKARLSEEEPKKQTPKTEAEVKPEPKETKTKENTELHKVKVNGQEIDVSTEELKRGYMHRQAADRLYNEAKQKEIKLNQLVSYLQDPDKAPDVLRHFGHDINKLAESIIYGAIQEDLLTPEEKQLKEERLEFERTRKELKAYKDIELQKQKAQERERVEKLALTRQGELKAEFIKAIDQLNLPNSNETIKEMATYIHEAANLKQPYKMSAIEAAQLVLEDMQSRNNRLLGTAEGEDLLKALGPETLKKVQIAMGKRVQPPFHQGTTQKSNENFNRQNAPNAPRKIFY